MDVVIASAITLFGCATRPDQDFTKTSAEKHEYSKNYVIGQPKTVNVGESIVKFQDYWTETSDLPVFVPSGNVSLVGGPVTVTLKAGVKAVFDQRRDGIADQVP